MIRNFEQIAITKHKNKLRLYSAQFILILIMLCYNYNYVNKNYVRMSHS